MATQKFVCVLEVRSPATTGNDDECELRAHIEAVVNDVKIELDGITFNITPNMTAAQKEAAMVAAIDTNLFNQYGVHVDASHLAYPWFFEPA